ncbi:MAG TPA: TfoX/Sxy family protein [Caulobacteraceae bacterium]|nr:TfoX/Sxy family protein [Caulobacteraceae bacterium]
MAVSPDFLALVEEQLAPLGPIRTRKMFGGAGVYAHDLMFALVMGETLYLKVDDVTEGEFAAAGSEPFVFTMKDGTLGHLRYWRLPEEATDDAEAAERWARLGLDAALRAKKPKKGAAARADIGPGPWDG